MVQRSLRRLRFSEAQDKSKRGESKQPKGMQWFTLVTSVTAFIISLMTFASSFIEHDKVEILISNLLIDVPTTSFGTYDTVNVNLGFTVLNEGNRTATVTSASV